MERKAYPRPELVRKNWTNLNGKWDFEFDFGATGRERKVYEQEKFSKKINVPFCPESKLSGIEYKDFINACWYRKTIKVGNLGTDRLLINFEAAYYTTYLYINGKEVGSHKGGYTPFSFDITEYVTEGDNTIVVYCEGDSRNTKQPSGKQSPKYNSYGCMYTRTTGIWQTVWLERVPAVYLKKIFIDTDIDTGVVTARVYTEGKGERKISLSSRFDSVPQGRAAVTTKSPCTTLQFTVKDKKLWDVENPNLYDLSIVIESESGKDTVSSYFGMRKIEIDGTQLKLNGKNIFMRMVLDQGFYPDGVYTAPTDEALLNDILLSQRFGFNGARLHEKVFERRFIYEADRHGYLVWGEYPNWGFDPSLDEGVQIYLPEWMESVERDYNHPSLIGWCPFNETWNVDGRMQNNELLRRIYLETKRFDPFRPVIDTSGNYHVVTDIFDIHDYNQNEVFLHERYKDFNENEVFVNYTERQSYTEGLPYFLSEYGGIKWTGDDDQGWGYGNAPKTLEEFETRYVGMIDAFRKNPRICGVCYTQLYDVEQERNGLYYYDRTPKFSNEMMDRMKKAMEETAEIEKLK